MSKITLFHGTPDQIIKPVFGRGDDKHDYGRGFYLTEDYELAKEWAVCRPNDTNGWVHKFELETIGLKILDFQEMDVLSWLAELMKHRDAADSRRYHMLAAQLSPENLSEIMLTSIFWKSCFLWENLAYSIALSLKRHILS